MARRELRVVRTEQVLGAVETTPDGVVFHDDAGNVFGGLRRVLGEEKCGAALMREGWSNGYLYLAPEQE